MLCSLPLFAALKKKYPFSHITLVVSPVHFGTNLKEINPFADEIIEYDKSSFRNTFKFYKKVRKRKYQLGIVPSTVKISRTSHIVNYLSGAKNRVGVKRVDNKSNPFHFLLNVKAGFDWDTNKVYQSDRNLDIARLIGCDLNELERNSIKIHLSEENRIFAQEFLKKYPSNKNEKLIAVHPGAGKTANRWHEDNFIELIRMINEKYSPRFLITSGKSDENIIAHVRQELDKKNIKYLLYNEASITKFAALLHEADLLITNDTGPMHIAEFVGTGTLSLFGPTKGYEWAPRGEKHKHIQSESGNINDITVSRVFNELSGMLENTSNI
jgi:heptosyltransferase-2